METERHKMVEIKCFCGKVAGEYEDTMAFLEDAMHRLVEFTVDHDGEPMCFDCFEDEYGSEPLIKFRPMKCPQCGGGLHTTRHTEIYFCSNDGCRIREEDNRFQEFRIGDLRAMYEENKHRAKRIKEAMDESKKERTQVWKPRRTKW